MNAKLKAALIVFGISIPIGVANMWLQASSDRAFDIYLMLEGVGFAIGVGLIPWILIARMIDPMAGYVAVVVINVFVSMGSARIHHETLSAAVAASGNPARVVVLVSSQSADGATQADMSQTFLGKLEAYTVERAQKKTDEQVASMGKAGRKVTIRSEANYLESNGVKLAIVRLATQSEFNVAFIHGIVGSELKRVFCGLEKDQAVVVSYGECGSMLNKTFGVNFASAQ